MSTRNYRLVLSPTMSSPERMEMSDESSFEQSPMNCYPTRPMLGRRQQNKSVSRRTSCPPPIQNDQAYFQERFGVRTPDPIASNRRTTGDFLDSIDKNFGFMQLNSPPGIQLNKPQSTPFQRQMSAPASTSTGKASSIFSFCSSNNVPLEENRSDYSDDSDVTTVSVSTVKTSENNNNKIEECKSDSLTSENLATLINSGYDKNREDDRKSTASMASFKTTYKEREAAKQTARLSNRRGLCLCYVHSVVLCLAIVILGYFGSLDLHNKWCITSQSFNVTQLKVELESKVFGQHVATAVITDALENFFYPKSDSSAKHSSIVFSFHGWTGIGKNYISNIISDLIPASSITKLIIPLHFPHSGSQYIELYEHTIKQWILTNISECTVNLFLIDEMDKATEPLLKGLESALQTMKTPEWNNTKVVVLMLSNTAGTALNKAAFMHLSNGFERNDLRSDMMQDVILTGDTVSWHKDLFEKGLIDHIVPFLPLQYEHVVRCISSYLQTRGIILPAKTINKIAKDFEYFPQGNPVFSKTGCKRVGAKTDLYLD